MNENLRDTFQNTRNIYVFLEKYKHNILTFVYKINILGKIK